MPHRARGGVEPVWLPLTDTTLLELLRGPADSPAPGAGCDAGWKGALHRLNNVAQQSDSVQQTELVRQAQEAEQAWFALVEDATGKLWSEAWQPTTAALHKLFPEVYQRQL